MTDLIKIKGLKGKQNKKKWNKNIDVTGLIEKAAQEHTDKVRQKLTPSLMVEEDTGLTRKPLDPDRFKSRGTPLPKPKYDNKLKKASLLEDAVEDVWAEDKKVLCKYKAPQVTAVINPSTGHSYNPSQEGINEVVDRIIDYEAQRQKKTKPIKKLVVKEQQIRHRNKKVRAQQLQLREKKAARQLLHEIHSSKKLAKQIEEKERQIQEKIQQKEQKQKKWQEEAKTGKVRYGKKIGKLQYRWREDLPNVEEAGKKLSHVGDNADLIKDRFDSVYRRGIFEPRVIKVHANKTKRIKSSLRYREDDEQQKKKDQINFVQ